MTVLITRTGTESPDDVVPGTSAPDRRKVRAFARQLFGAVARGQPA